MGSWIVLAVILSVLAGIGTVLSGDITQWSSTLAAVAFLVPAKWLNDRVKLLAWPMEFLLASGVTMIVFSMIRLYFTPLPY